MANKKARVLVAGLIGGIAYQPNDVVNLPDVLAKAAAESGAVDLNKESVAYALSLNSGQVIEHAEPEAAAPAEAVASPAADQPLE